MAKSNFANSADTAAMLHWENLDQVPVKYTKGPARAEVPSDVAPCTPMQSMSQLKSQNYQTPESSCILPSLSLAIGSSEMPKDAVLETPNQTSQAPFVNDTSNFQQSYLQQQTGRSVQFATLTPSKNLNTIQQRERQEFHNENLLTSPLPEHDKWMQVCRKPDRALSLGHYFQDVSPQRIIVSQELSKASPSQRTHSPKWTQYSNGFQNGHSMLPDCSPVGAKASSGLAFSGCLDFAFESEAKRVFQETSLEMKSFSPPVDSQNIIIHSGLTLPFTANGMYTTSRLPVKQDLSEANVQVECVKYMQHRPGTSNYSRYEEQITNGNADEHGHSGKRRKSLSLQNDVAPSNGHRWDGPCVFLADHHPCNNDASNPTNKIRQAAEQPKATVCELEATDRTSQWYNQLTQNAQKQGHHPMGYTEKHELSPDDIDYNKLKVSLRMLSTEKNGKDSRISDEGYVASQPSPLGMKEQQQNSSRLTASLLIEKFTSADVAPQSERHSMVAASDAADKVSVQSIAFTTPANTQIANGVSTLLADEASLPLSLEFPQKVPDVGVGQTPMNVGSSTDADWGKFLALSATPSGNTEEIDTNNVLPFQQRFNQLQAFLKRCNESDPKDCVQALRSLSASARSGHAVELETRAIRLALQEGEEMKRMKSLNVLGRNHDRNFDDAGGTPQGPKLPAPWASCEFK